VIPCDGINEFWISISEHKITYRVFHDANYSSAFKLVFNCLLLESVFWIGVSDPLYIAVRSGGCGRFELLRVRPGECVPSPGHESLLVCVCLCVDSTRYFIFCWIKSGTGDWNPSPFKADKSLFILLVHLLWHYVEDIQSTHTSGSLRTESLCRSVVYARHIINQAILCKYRMYGD